MISLNSISIKHHGPGPHEGTNTSQGIHNPTGDTSSYSDADTIVNPDGSPTIFYHGTTGDFPAEEFKPKYSKDEQLGFGIHFAETPEFAELYAEKKGGNIRPVKILAKKILDVDELVIEGTPEYELAKEIFKGTRHKFVSGEGEDGKRRAIIQLDATSPKRAERILRKYGYDAIRYTSKMGRRFIQHGRMGFEVSAESRSIVVLDAKQIVPVIGRKEYDELMRLKHITGNPDHDSPEGQKRHGNRASKSSVEKHDLGNGLELEIDHDPKADLKTNIDDWGDPVKSLRRWVADNVLQASYGHKMLLKDHGELVGALHYIEYKTTLRDYEEYAIEWFATKRRGYGRTMFKMLVDKCKEKGFGLNLYAMSGSTQFYTKMGMREVPDRGPGVYELSPDEIAQYKDYEEDEPEDGAFSAPPDVVKPKLDSVVIKHYPHNTGTDQSVHNPNAAVVNAMRASNNGENSRYREEWNNGKSSLELTTRQWHDGDIGPDDFDPDKEVDRIKMAVDYVRGFLKSPSGQKLTKILEPDSYERMIDSTDKRVFIHAIMTDKEKDAGWGNAGDSSAKVFYVPYELKRGERPFSSTATSFGVDPLYVVTHELHHVFGSDSEFDDFSTTVGLGLHLSMGNKLVPKMVAFSISSMYYSSMARAWRGGAKYKKGYRASLRWLHETYPQEFEASLRETFSDGTDMVLENIRSWK